MPLHKRTWRYAEAPDLLRQRLMQLHMNQREFALRMGRYPKTINEILQGVSAMEWRFAIHCEYVLNLPAELLMSMQTNEDLEHAHVYAVNGPGVAPVVRKSDGTLVPASRLNAETKRHD